MGQILNFPLSPRPPIYTPPPPRRLTSQGEPAGKNKRASEGAEESATVAATAAGVKIETGDAADAALKAEAAAAVVKEEQQDAEELDEDGATKLVLSGARASLPGQKRRKRAVDVVRICKTGQKAVYMGKAVAYQPNGLNGPICMILLTLCHWIAFN